MSRITEQHAFMKHAIVASERSTCIRRRIGAVVAADGKIVSTGYNGAPRGLPHCTDIGCLRDELEIESGTHHEVCRATHAEQNALMYAGFKQTLGADLYTTTYPCSICAKMIINAGIARIYYLVGYPDETAKKYLKQAGIIIQQLVMPDD